MDAGRKVVEFSTDRIAFVNSGGEVRKTAHHLRNRTEITRKLRVALAKDSDKCFRLLSGKDERAIAGGLRLPIALQYSPDSGDRNHSATLEVFADDKLQMRIPVVGEIPAPSLSLSATVLDFGDVVGEHQTVTNTVAITNAGSATGRYSVSLHHLPDYITVTPSTGEVPAGQQQCVTVSILCRSKHLVEEHMSVMIEPDGPAHDVKIVANIVPRQLELLDTQSLSPVTVLRLGTAYYGSVVTARAVLHNNSPGPTRFVAMLNSQNAGMEGVDMGRTLSLACTEGGLRHDAWREQGGCPATSTLLQVNPPGGTMAPHEKRTIEFTFAPVFEKSKLGWSGHQGPQHRRDYAMFVSFLPVGSTSREGAAELGVTASAVPVQLECRPGKLTFGECPVGQLATQSLNILNTSDSLQLQFHCQPPAHFKTSVSRGCVGPGRSLTMEVTFQPRQLGPLGGKLSISAMAPTARESFIPIHTTSVDLLAVGANPLMTKTRKRKTVLAKLDDLSHSIRPSDRTLDVRTKYTHMPRHTYVDRDYSFTDREAELLRRHRHHYQDYLRNSRLQREWLQEDKKLGSGRHRNPVDIGLMPAAGLNPPELTVQEALTSDGSSGAVDSRGISTTLDLAETTSRELNEVATPETKLTSSLIAGQCSALLSPQELSNVVVDASRIDFGEVVIGTEANFPIKVKNFLRQHLLVKFKVECDFLKLHLPPGDQGPGKSFVQFILPPMSLTCMSVNLSGEHEAGDFHQSVHCLINKDHAFHIPVAAQLTVPCLRPSSHLISLVQPPLAMPTAGMQGSVSLDNPHDIPIEFRWEALDESNTLYITNPGGVVPANSSLLCEFIAQVTVSSPKELPVALHIPGTPGLPLTCQLQFERPQCLFTKEKVLFGIVPLNLTTVSRVALKNSGKCHAYFEVLNTIPELPGLTVTPSEGCVPAGGSTIELSLSLLPTSVGTFESQLRLRLREGRVLSLRLAGSVEAPDVFLDREDLTFGGVFCGAVHSLPFTVVNKGSTRTELFFDLSHWMDFTLTLLSTSDPYQDKGQLASRTHSDNTYSLNIPSKTSTRCTMKFSPKEVAAYDFILPVMVNNRQCVSPPLSSWPPSHSRSQVTLGSRLPRFEDTPKRRVLATALTAPLSVSDIRLELKSLPKEIVLQNVSTEPVTWALGGLEASAVGGDMKRMEDDTFQLLLPSKEPFLPPSSTAKTPSPGEVGHLLPGQKFTFLVQFCPAHHGRHTARAPLLLNGCKDHPYRVLEFSGDIPPPRITTSPLHIAILPVPLGVTVEAEFSVHVDGLLSGAQLEVELPSPLPRGVELAASFVHGDTITQTTAQLPCVISFCSTSPVSITDCITLIENGSGRTKDVPFTVAADNSVFSVYEFFSGHLNSMKMHFPPDSVLPSLSLSSPVVPVSSSALLGVSSRSASTVQLNSRLSTSASVDFGDIFLQDCRSVMCRYLSIFGWPEGTKFIERPTDLIESIGNAPTSLKERYSSALGASRGPLIDLLRHILGRLPPGLSQIPQAPKSRSDRVNYHYEELNAVLVFLKSQMALLWVVTPEALMDYRDFRIWREINPNLPSLLSCVEDEAEFHDISYKCWMHLLAQIIKILILPKLVSKTPKDLLKQLPSDQAGTNIYSRTELLLLLWINKKFEENGSKVFGVEVPQRKIATFDVDLMDCTMLACVIASYVPHLIKSHFRRMYVSPANPEQCMHNAILLVEAVRSIGFTYDIQPSDLLAPNPIGLVLFAARLLRGLPHYVPAATVALRGPLHATVSQQIELQNPTGKYLSYRAVFYGEDVRFFDVGTKGQKTIAVPPNGKILLPVHFTGRRLTTCEVVLLLVCEEGCRGHSRTMSFVIRGEVTVAMPLVTEQAVACLYEHTLVPLEIMSPFDKGDEFSVSLVEGEQLQSTFKLAPSKSKAGIKQKSKMVDVITCGSLVGRSTDAMELFHCQTSRLFLASSGEKHILVLEFVPLRMRPRQCCVLLCGEDVGDLVLLVTVTVKHPRPSIPRSSALHGGTLADAEVRTLHMKSTVGETFTEELIIHGSNPAFEAAVLNLSQWQTSTEELRRRSITDSIGYASLQTAIESLQLEDRPKSYWDRLPPCASYLRFSVTCNSDFATLPDSIAIPATKSGKALLPLEFRCDREGHYGFQVELASEYDIRVYNLEVMVLAKERTAALEFRTLAAQPLSQDIPLANPSTLDWPLRAVLEGAGFSGPPYCTIPALSTGFYPLTFLSHKPGTSKGELLLVNTNDRTEHRFHLTGVADWPVAAKTIRIHTQAKTRTAHKIHVANPGGHTTTYRVDTDLDFISGPPSITVGNNDVEDYLFMVEPLERGIFTGAIVVTAQSSSTVKIIPDASGSIEHMWYRLEVTVDPAPISGVILITGRVFLTVTKEISVGNPFPELARLKVSFTGECLSGPEELEIEAGGEALYPILFSPNTVGNYSGSVLFTGRCDGEFAYDIELEVLDPLPVTVPLMQAELGRQCQRTLTLPNPLSHNVTLCCHCSDTDHFFVAGLKDGKLTLLPSSSTEVIVVFKPKAVATASDKADVLMTSKEYGIQRFLLQGEGLLPREMDPIHVTAPLAGSNVAVVQFANPLGRRAHFDVKLSGDPRDQFCLLLKVMRDILLEPDVSVDIPVVFAPEAMMLAEAAVVVSTATESTATPDSKASLEWTYPIFGEPELKVAALHGIPRVTGRARERTEYQLQLVLAPTAVHHSAAVARAATPGNSIGRAVGTINSALWKKYSYELVCGEEGAKAVVSHATGIKLVGERYDSQDESTTLTFSLVFLPSKPFRSDADIRVQTPTNGRWRFPLEFIAREAEPDDIITLEASKISEDSKIGFRLTSKQEWSQKFTAYFASGSSNELSVSPSAGLLPPVGSKGALITVGFRPHSLDKTRLGRLIVETESAQWCYKVIGKPATYASPSLTAKPKIDSNQSVFVPHKQLRNFVRHNIQLATSTNC